MKKSQSQSLILWRQVGGVAALQAAITLTLIITAAVPFALSRVPLPRGGLGVGFYRKFGFKTPSF